MPVGRLVHSHVSSQPRWHMPCFVLAAAVSGEELLLMQRCPHLELVHCTGASERGAHGSAPAHAVSSHFPVRAQARRCRPRCAVLPSPLIAEARVSSTVPHWTAALSAAVARRPSPGPRERARTSMAPPASPRRIATRKTSPGTDSRPRPPLRPIPSHSHYARERARAPRHPRTTTSSPARPHHGAARSRASTHVAGAPRSNSGRAASTSGCAWQRACCDVASPPSSATSRPNSAANRFPCPCSTFEKGEKGEY